MGVYGSRVCNKIIVLFIAMIAGFIAKKAKLIDAKSTKSLSALLASITNPCLIVSSLQTDCTAEVMQTAGTVLLCSFAVHTVLAFLSGFIFKPIKDVRDRSVYSFGLMYMNCGFMGFPIMQAMFPENGLFYGVIYNIAFNLFVWTHGVFVMDKSEGAKVNLKKIFLNPGIISTVLAVVLFVTGVRFPAVITEGLDMVGGMTFPLSMIIIGSLLGDIKLLSLFKDVKLLLFALLKLAAVPLIMLGICVAFQAGLGFTAAMVCITMCATPTATVTAVLAEVYDNNSSLAAKLVGVTTLFSLVSMPLVLILAENLLK